MAKITIDASWPEEVKLAVGAVNAGRKTLATLKTEHPDWFSFAGDFIGPPKAFTGGGTAPDAFTAVAAPPKTPRQEKKAAVQSKISAVEEAARQQGTDLKAGLEQQMLAAGWSKDGIAQMLPTFEASIAVGTPPEALQSIIASPPDQFRASAYIGQLPSPSDLPQAREFYGFTSPFTEPTPTGVRGPRGEEVPIPGQAAGTAGLPTGSFKGGEYQYNPDTGGIRYKNGVIADPQSGSIYYPTDRAVPGNMLWLRDVQQTWSGAKVKEMRKRLADLGYMAKTDAKKQGFDSQFLGALMDYQRDRYLNFGTPVPTGVTPGARTGATTNFRKVRATVRSDVFRQFHALFGNDPKDPHVDRFTDYVIRTANRLQTKGLSPSEAETEAISRIEQSPGVEYDTANTMENTALHDALSSAVSATAGLYR